MATPVFLESFYPSDLTSRWQYVSGSRSVGSGRFGNNAFQLTSGGGTLQRQIPYSSSITVNCALQWPTGNANINGGFSIRAPWNSPFGNRFFPDLCTLTTADDRTIIITANSGNVFIASSGFAPKSNQWVYVELSCVLSGGTNISATVSLKINGNLVINGASASTGISTSGTLALAAEADTVNWFASNFGLLVSDIAIGTSGFFTDDMKILNTVPNADGTCLFTPSTNAYAIMAANPPTGQVSSPNVGDYDDFDVATSSDNPANSTPAVQVSFLAQKDNPEQPRTLSARVNGSAVGAEYAVTGAAVTYSTCVTSVATVGDVNSDTFGFEVAS